MSHLTESDLDWMEELAYRQQGRVPEFSRRIGMDQEHARDSLGNWTRTYQSIALDPATVHELVQLARLGLALLDETEPDGDSHPGADLEYVLERRKTT